MTWACSDWRVARPDEPEERLAQIPRRLEAHDQGSVGLKPVQASLVVCFLQHAGGLCSKRVMRGQEVQRQRMRSRYCAYRPAFS